MIMAFKSAKNMSRMLEPLPGCQFITVTIQIVIVIDYGLMCTITSLYSASILHFIDPISFIRYTLIWPCSIEKYAINITVGPNFSWALVGRKLRESKKKYDVSSLFRVDMAAEPIMESTVTSMLKDWGILNKLLIFHRNSKELNITFLWDG